MDRKSFRIGQDALKGLMRVVNGQKVLLDRDAAEYFEVDVKDITRCVKRHRRRFPADFMVEFIDAGNVDRPMLGAARGFTEAGIGALAMLLKSPKAAAHSVETIRELFSFLRRRRGQ